MMSLLDAIPPSAFAAPPPTRMAVEDARAAQDWSNLLEAIDEFRERMPEGHKMMVTPSLDPTFHIEDAGRKGDFVHLRGVDDAGDEVLVIQHRTQLSLRLVSVAPEVAPARGTFGFLDPDR